MTLRQIKPEELGRFSIDDENNRLYWDNKAVQTESVVVLSGKQTFWGIVIATATILGAAATCIYTWTYVRVTHGASPTCVVQIKAPEAVTPPAPCPAPNAETAPPAHNAPKSPPEKTPPKKQQ